MRSRMSDEKAYPYHLCIRRNNHGLAWLSVANNSSLPLKHIGIIMENKRKTLQPQKYQGVQGYIPMRNKFLDMKFYEK